MPEKTEDKKPVAQPAAQPEEPPVAVLVAAVNALTERLEQVEMALLDLSEQQAPAETLTAVAAPAAPSRRRIVDYHRRGVVLPAIVVNVNEPQRDGEEPTVDLVVFGSNFGSAFRVDRVPEGDDHGNEKRGHWEWGELAPLPTVEDAQEGVDA